jgi:hypothetical protein
MVSSLRRAIPALPALTAVAAVAAVALPAVAAAATPRIGHYDSGGAVTFVVRHGEHGTAYVDEARYHALSGFERVPVRGGGEFETCARHRINAILFRDTCIRGTFTSEHAASGAVAVYNGAHGHRAAHPYETHHWSAALG